MKFIIDNIYISQFSVGVKLIPDDPTLLTIKHLRINLSKPFYHNELRIGDMMDLNIDHFIKLEKHVINKS
ncbi:MAG TPA: hypothetical protein VE912_23545 [Bacteroidales bacterium]|nr:hypothetical protein [Bacteroidales bacterium]